ncbi:MAG: glycosyltransferase family 4 protein, partial [Myxococcales bacterium]
MNSALLLPASILAAVAAFLIGALITPIVRDLATHMRVVDRAGSFRKVHTHPIPRLGGIAILIAWWSALCAAVATFPAFRAEFGHQELRWFALIGGCIAAAALGTFDDVR